MSPNSNREGSPSKSKKNKDKQRAVSPKRSKSDNVDEDGDTVMKNVCSIYDDTVEVHEKYIITSSNQRNFVFSNYYEKFINAIKSYKPTVKKILMKCKHKDIFFHTTLIPQLKKKYILTIEYIKTQRKKGLDLKKQENILKKLKEEEQDDEEKMKNEEKIAIAKANKKINELTRKQNMQEVTKEKLHNSKIDLLNDKFEQMNKRNEEIFKATKRGYDYVNREKRKRRDDGFQESNKKRKSDFQEEEEEEESDDKEENKTKKTKTETVDSYDFDNDDVFVNYLKMIARIYENESEERQERVVFICKKIYIKSINESKKKNLQQLRDAVAYEIVNDPEYKKK